MPDIYRIDQALFGYKGGHHLLAASASVGPKELERLLILTDIAPNASFGGADGYWTGAPLPDTDRYAVIRTWPAPEMPRPGCVWSHVLIFSSALVNRAWDVKSLTRLFIRPVIEDGFDRYQNDLALMQPEPVEDWSEDETFVEVLRTVYGDGRAFLNPHRIRSIGAALLTAWSQQWPELRSSFRFRTLPKQANSRNPLLQFDFYLAATEKYSITERSWIPLAEKDANASQPSQFRKYLRTFGPLVDPTLPGFALLAQAYAMKFGYGERSVSRLMEALNRGFPDADEAAGFKRQMFNYDEAFEDLLWDGAAFETARGLVESVGGSPYSDGLLGENNIAFLWKHDFERMVELLRLAADKKNDFASRFLEAVAMKTARDQLTSTKIEPELYLVLAKYDESLLSPSAIREFGEDHLRRIIAALEDRTPVARIFCETLYQRDLTRGIVEALFEQVPLVAVKQASNSLSSSLNREPANTLWLEVASAYATHALNHGVLSEFVTSAELAAFAELLDYFQSEIVIAVGALPWSRALEVVKDDVDGSARATLQAFLLALALKRPDEAAIALLRYSFESLHRALWESTLNHQASVLIEPVLPHPRWFWQSWDVCLRLRRGVLRALIDGRLPPADLLSLTSDTALLGLMLEALDESRFEDRRFGEAVLRSAAEASKASRNWSELVN